MTVAHHNLGVVSRQVPPVSAYLDIACTPEDDLEVFFPDKSAEVYAKDAKRICNSCPHRDECLLWALETAQEDGVWGGKTARERRQMIKTRAELKKLTTRRAS